MTASYEAAAVTAAESTSPLEIDGTPAWKSTWADGFTAAMAARRPSYPLTWLRIPDACWLLEYPPRNMVSGLAAGPSTSTRYGPASGTRSGSKGWPCTGSLRSSTRRAAAADRLSASRGAIWVTAWLASELTHVPAGTAVRARATHGTRAGSSNSPSRIRAVKSRTSDVSRLDGVYGPTSVLTRCRTAARNVSAKLDESW